MSLRTNLEGGILMATATTETEEPNAYETLEQVKREVKEGFTSLAKKGLANMLVQRKELVLKLGKALEKVRPNKQTICSEIKEILKDEIDAGLISKPTIMSYCREEWKQKDKVDARKGRTLQRDSDIEIISENTCKKVLDTKASGGSTSGHTEASATTCRATIEKKNISVKLSRKDLCRIAGIVQRCREYGIVHLSPDGVLVDITPDTEIEREAGERLS
jgi:hypothetical protein